MNFVLRIWSFSRKYIWEHPRRIASGNSKSFTFRKNCAYSELFWFVFSCIRTEYGEILRISLYLVQIRENADQNNSEYGHLLRSVNQGLLERCFQKDVTFSFVFLSVSRVIVKILSNIKKRFTKLVEGWKPILGLCIRPSRKHLPNNPWLNVFEFPKAVLLAAPRPLLRRQADSQYAH